MIFMTVCTLRWSLAQRAPLKEPQKKKYARICHVKYRVNTRLDVNALTAVVSVNILRSGAAVSRHAESTHPQLVADFRGAISGAFSSAVLKNRKQSAVCPDLFVICLCFSPQDPGAAVTSSWHSHFLKPQRFSPAGRRTLDVCVWRFPRCRRRDAVPGASGAEFRECRTVPHPAVLVGAVWGGQGQLPAGAVPAGSEGTEGSLWRGGEGCSLPARQPGSTPRAGPSRVHRQREEEWPKLSVRVGEWRWVSTRRVEWLEGRKSAST